MNNPIWIIEIVNTKDRFNETYTYYFSTQEEANQRIQEFEREDRALNTNYYNYYTYKLLPF